VPCAPSVVGAESITSASWNPLSSLINNVGRIKFGCALRI
jgi:hypothetical protein